MIGAFNDFDKKNFHFSALIGNKDRSEVWCYKTPSKHYIFAFGLDTSFNEISNDCSRYWHKNKYMINDEDIIDEK